MTRITHTLQDRLLNSHGPAGGGLHQRAGAGGHGSAMTFVTDSRVIRDFRANEGRVTGAWASTPPLLLHHSGAKAGAT
jgi:hypothetical protein